MKDSNPFFEPSISLINSPCLRTLIDLNDAWIPDGSIKWWNKLLLTWILFCHQGQHRRKILLDRIRLNKHSESLDSIIWNALTLALFPFPSITPSPCQTHSLPLQIVPYLATLPSISPPADSGVPRRLCVFSLLRVKYNIYHGLFEFTHPYHWVCSPWLWGGLVLDSLTLRRSWNMHTMIKGDGKRDGISTGAHKLKLMCCVSGGGSHSESCK